MLERKINEQNSKIDWSLFRIYTTCSIKCSLFIDGQICVERINVQEQNSNLTVPRRSQVILPSSNFSCHGRVNSFVAHFSKKEFQSLYSDLESCEWEQLHKICEEFCTKRSPSGNVGISSTTGFPLPDMSIFHNFVWLSVLSLLTVVPDSSKSG